MLKKNNYVDHSWGPFGMQWVEEAFKRDVGKRDGLQNKR